jgi:transposase
MDNATPGVGRRGDLLVGPERRRKWPLKKKLAIVAESFEPGAIVSHIAQRHGIRPQQLFDWRRRVREHVPGTPMPGTPTRSSGTEALWFATVEPTAPVAVARTSTSEPTSASGSIEISIGAAVIKISGPVDARGLAAVLRALKTVS